MRKIKKAKAVYTGGNIWVFYGDLEDGNYFLVDDDGYTTILDSSIENGNDEVWDANWQNAHKIEYLGGDERIAFCNELVDYLMVHGSSMSDDELIAYKKWFAIEP